MELALFVAGGFALWLGLSIYLANQASRRKLSGFGWFFASFLLSPLVAFLMYTAKTATGAYLKSGAGSAAAKTAGGPVPAEDWLCPTCTAINPGDVYECQECHYRLV